MIFTFFQAKNPHGVQRVYEGEAESKPFTVGFGDWFQLVMAPGELLVSLPGVTESLDDPLLPLADRD